MKIAARDWRDMLDEAGIQSVHVAPFSRFTGHSLWPWPGSVGMSFVFPLFLVALTCSIAFGSSGQTSESPTEVVRSTLTEVFHILEDENLKDPAKLISRRDRQADRGAFRNATVRRPRRVPHQSSVA